MSKAFTDEESQDSAVIGRPPSVAPRGQERPITTDGHRALTGELQRLSTVERARVHGLTDDAEREAQAKRLEHRLALLAATLSSVRVVEVPAPDGEVRFGSRVTLAWDDGRTQRLHLVGPDEADSKAGRVSVESPLGRTLLGQRQGDTVEVERPRGVGCATLVTVE
ncbi:MAG: GreA/GreB family elongation factor [Myxococcales bacterium]|nr:GreA/GreB family elongation factor [Myxococcales bacterium]